MPTITLREAFVSDAEGVARVHRETWRTTYQGILPAAAIESDRRRNYEALWADVIVRRKTRVLVAETETADIVGFVSFGAPREKGVTYDIEVYQLYVLQMLQKRGIGRALLGEVARRMLRDGMFSFYLWALKANPSRLFYEAMGAEVITERTLEIGGQSAVEVAYGWSDLTRFLPPKRSVSGELK
jgi:L-amino acid N-acyltransferase YncA